MLRNPRILLYIALAMALFHLYGRAEGKPAPNLNHRICKRYPPEPAPPKSVVDSTYVAVNDKGEDVEIPRRFRKDARGVTLDFLSEAEVDRICAGGIANCDLVYYACDNACRITAPNPCLYLDQSFAETLCHKLAHVNGWRT